MMKPFFTPLLAIIHALFLPMVFSVEADTTTFDSSLDFAQVEKVVASQSDNGTWCFATTVRHNDQGWQHYADNWQVLDEQGAQLGFRKLHHPHNNEQPFTRSLCDVHIPNGTKTVTIRAKCNKHGYGGKAVVVTLNALNKSAT